MEELSRDIFKCKIHIDNAIGDKKIALEKLLKLLKLWQAGTPSE